jgi:hypothetical protein
MKRLSSISLFIAIIFVFSFIAGCTPTQKITMDVDGTVVKHKCTPSYYSYRWEDVSEEDLYGEEDDVDTYDLIAFRSSSSGFHSSSSGFRSSSSGFRSSSSGFRSSSSGFRRSSSGFKSSSGSHSFKSSSSTRRSSTGFRSSSNPIHSGSKRYSSSKFTLPKNSNKPYRSGPLYRRDNYGYHENHLDNRGHVYVPVIIPYGDHYRRQTRYYHSKEYITVVKYNNLRWVSSNWEVYQKYQLGDKVPMKMVIVMNPKTKETLSRSLQYSGK